MNTANPFPVMTTGISLCSKGTFYSESAGEMWNRHIKVPNIVPGLLYPVSNMNCSNKMIILTFFYVNKINVFKAGTDIYWVYNQWFLNLKSNINIRFKYFF